MNTSDRKLHALVRRVRLTIGRALVRLVNDGSGIQTAQVSLMGNETRDKLERFQEYGFTSVPKAGAEAAVVFVGGCRDHGIIVAIDDRRVRLKGLAEGEVAIYTDEGDSIILKRGNNIEINTATLTVKASDKVRMETPLLEVTGDIIDTCDTNPNNMAGMRAIYNTHTHNENNNPGGPTNAPNQGM